MSNILNVRLPAELLERLDAYCDQHALTRSQAIRVAAGRLLKSPPAVREREAATVDTGAAAHRREE